MRRGEAAAENARWESPSALLRGTREEEERLGVLRPRARDPTPLPRREAPSLRVRRRAPQRGSGARAQNPRP